MNRRFNNEKFKEAVVNSYSWNEVSRKLQVHSTGERNRQYKRLCAELNLDYSHIKGLRWFQRERVPENFKWGNRIPLEEILTENSIYKGGSNHIKNRLIKASLLENKCSLCGNEGEWNGLKLTLQLDHINGISSDNRLENLRILCPNCHSQTRTYGAKKRSHL